MKEKKLRLGSKKEKMREVVKPRKQVNFVGQFFDPRSTCWRLRRPKFDYISDAHIWLRNPW